MNSLKVILLASLVASLASAVDPKKMVRAKSKDSSVTLDGSDNSVGNLGGKGADKAVSIDEFGNSAPVEPDASKMVRKKMPTNGPEGGPTLDKKALVRKKQAKQPAHDDAMLEAGAAVETTMVDVTTIITTVYTVAPTSTAQYVMGDRGTSCATGAKITSSSECEQAMETVGLSVQMLPMDQYDYPKGCNFDVPHQKVYFNSANSQIPTHPSAHPLCRTQGGPVTFSSEGKKLCKGPTWNKRYNPVKRLFGGIGCKTLGECQETAMYDGRVESITAKQCEGRCLSNQELQSVTVGGATYSARCLGFSWYYHSKYPACVLCDTHSLEGENFQNNGGWSFYELGGPGTPTPDVVEVELQASATLSASASSSSGGPEKAIDGSSETAWNAGTSADESWLELAWTSPKTISYVEFEIEQTPLGITKWTFWADGTKLHGYRQRTSSGTKLPYFFQTPQQMTKLRIQRDTVEEGGSWCAIREVKVLGY